MKRNIRLTRSTDFQRVRQNGKSYAHPLVVLIALPNQLDITRFGVAAGRSVGTAVRRNRAKRLLRESLRALAPSILPGWDLVIIARAPVREASLVQIKDALYVLFRRARLLQENNDR